jgi:hypothetical protein
VFLEISALLTLELFNGTPIIKDTVTKILKCATLDKKTLFGSDGPRPTKKFLEIIKEADYISTEDKNRMLGDTADWLLKANNEEFRNFLTNLPLSLGSRTAVYTE